MVFTTPAIGALRRRFPDARITYLVEAPAEPVVRHHPDLDEIIVVERPRGLARWRYDLAPRAPAARAALRPGDRFPRRPAQRLADVGDAARRSASATTCRDGVVLHDARAVDAIARAAAPLGRSISGRCSSRSASSAPDRARDPVAMPPDAERSPRVDARLRPPASTPTRR